MIENKLKKFDKLPLRENNQPDVQSLGGIYTEFYDGDTIYTTEILQPRTEERLSMRRTYENSNIRVDSIDCENKTLVDLGCNVGLITTECAKKGAKYCLGIDSMTPVIDIAKFTAEEQGLKNIDFICHDFPDYFEEIVSDKYDIALILSVGNYVETIGTLERLCHIAPIWYVEPTNHPNHEHSKEEIKKWGQTELSKFGNVEFIRFTDYQDRGMFRLTIKA
jgi:SAM-dependent methyltransferase